MKIKGIYFFLYRILQAFGLPLLLLYLLFRGLRSAAYRRSLAERFGFLPPTLRQTGPGAIWLHAVSVGEVLSCARFAAGLRAAFPRSPVFLSTATVAGYAAARQKLGGVASGVFYAPVDTVWAVRRVLRALRPSVVVVAETEIWPNLFRETKRTGAALAIVNGRISDRAFPRYRRLPGVWRTVLRLPGLVLAQSPAMAERFRALGAPPARLRDGGNFKYDFEPHSAPPGSPVLEWAAGGGTVWIAASTMPPAEAGDPDEDDAVIAAHLELRRTHPDLRLILVPRKPERFDRAAKKLEAAGLEYVRRSSLPPATPYGRVADPLSAAGPPQTSSRPAKGSGPAAALPRVLLLDTIGELSGLFGAADVVFMGGTLARRGGHNILEPAFFSQAGDRGSAHGKFSGHRRPNSMPPPRASKLPMPPRWPARWRGCSTGRRKPAPSPAARRHARKPAAAPPPAPSPPCASFTIPACRNTAWRSPGTRWHGRWRRSGSGAAGAARRAPWPPGASCRSR